MAKNYWFGKDIKLNVTNKAADNSGIASVTSSATDLPFSIATVSDITNKKAKGGNSTATFTAIANNAVNAGTKGSKTFAANTVGIVVNWTSGGHSDSHPIGEDIVLCREATAAAVNVSKLTVWSDETMPTVSVSATSESGTTPYKTAPYAIFSSNAANLPVSDPATAKNSFVPELVETEAIAGTKTITFGATTVASDVPTATAAATSELTASTNTVNVKNAAASITLNNESTPTSETSIYLKMGEAKEVAYTVNPHISVTGSTLFSAEVMFEEEPKTAATAAKKDGEYVYVLTPAKVGSTKLQLKSTQTSNADGILSSIVNIYVSIANETKYLNMGDAISIDMGTHADKIEVSKNNANWSTGTMVTLTASDAAADNSVSAAAGTGSNVTFSVGTNATEGDHFFRINGATVITIHVSHVAVALV